MNIRRRRVIGIAIAGVLVGLTGVAFAVVPDHGGERRQIRVAARADNPDQASTTTVGQSGLSTSTVAVMPTTTTTDPAPLPSPGKTSIAPQPASPADLAGSIGLAGTTVRLHENTAVVLTLTNVSDHPVSLRTRPEGDPLMISLLRGDAEKLGGVGLDDDVPVLAPGEVHVFTTSLWADSRIGPARLVARMRIFGECPPVYYECMHDTTLPGVPPVDVTVVPPGWQEGMPLDPTLAHWAATMSADSNQVADDGTVVVHARIRNLSDDVAKTRGYGSLAIMCQTAVEGTATLVDHVVDPVTLAPGASGVFSVEFDLADAQAHGVWFAPSVTRLQCSVGMKYDEQDDPYNLPAWTDPAIASDTVVIRVTHPTTTSTSAASADA